MTAAPDPERLALDARQLGNALNLSLRAIRRADSAGRLPRPVRVGRSVRWPVEEIRRWLAAGAPRREVWEQLAAEVKR